LTEELRVSHRRVVKGHMVVHGSIKVFPVCCMSGIIVFGALNVEVGDPAELSIDIAVLGNSRIIRHPRSFDLIHLVRIWLSLRLN